MKKMRLLLIAAILLLAMLASCAFAEETVTVDGIIYTLHDDGTATLTGDTGDLPGEIIVPEEVNGHTVTALGNGVFSCANELVIHLPDTIERVGSGVLYDTYMCMVDTEWSEEKAKSLAQKVNGSSVSFAAGEGSDFKLSVRTGWTEEEPFNYGLAKYLGNDANLVLPQKVGGREISEISVNFAKGNPYIQSLVIPAGYWDCGNSAFANCTALKSVDMSECEILFHANKMFQGCTSLEEVTMNMPVEGGPSLGNYMFDGCTSLKKVTFPYGMADMGDGEYWACNWAEWGYYTFRNCTSLESIVLDPAMSVYSLQDGTFQNCSSLKYLACSVDMNIYMDDLEVNPFDGCENLSLGVFRGSFMEEFARDNDIPYTYLDQLSEGGYYYIADAVQDRAVITAVEGSFSGKVEVPDQLGGCPVKKIADSVFAGQENISEIILPDSIEYIGVSCFSGCTSLTRIKLPANLEGIDMYTFENCSSLKNLYLPDKLWYIDESAFEGCSAFETLYVTEGSDTEECFEYIDLEYTLLGKGEGFYYLAEDEESCKIFSIVDPDIEELVIPGEIDGYRVISIVSEAFRGNKTITSLTVESGIQSLGEGSFRDCTALKSINLPDKLDSISRYAFAGCTSLEEFVTPKNLMGIESYAFYGCTKLKTVEINPHMSRMMMSIGISCFENCTALETISFPDGLVLEEIRQRGFANCSSLKNVQAPGNMVLNCLGNEAFLNCAALEKIFLPKEVYDFGENVFAGCTKLKLQLYKGSSAEEYAVACNIPYEYFNEYTENGYTYIIDDVVQGARIRAFSGKPDENGYLAMPDFLGGSAVKTIDQKVFLYNEDIIRVKLPSQLESIQKEAFLGSTVEWVEAPVTLKYIGNDAFCDTPLQYIDMPERIGIGAFLKSDLTEVTMNNNTTDLPSSVFYGCKNLTSVTLSRNLKTIEYDAFGACTGLNKLLIPESVEFIDPGAFEGCKNLTLIVFADSYGHRFAESNGMDYSLVSEDGVFYYAKRWSDWDERYEYVIIGIDDSFSGHLVIPNEIDGYRISAIGDEAFRGNKKITSLTVESGIQELGEGSFRDCTALKSINLPDDLDYISSYAFAGCTSLEEFIAPYSLLWVNDHAFYGCTALKYVEMSKGVEAAPSIDESAFEGCTALETVIFPENASFAELGKRAFANCAGLKTFHMPDSMRLAWIGEETFLNCGALENLNLPYGLYEFQADSFKGCSSLTLKVYQGSEAERLAKEYGIPYVSVGVKESGDYTYTWDEDSKTATIIGYVGTPADGVLEIPASLDGYAVVKITNHAFEENENLQKVVIPEGVTELDTSAFCWCVNLEEVQLPESLVKIGDTVFEACFALKTLNWPASLREIGSGAFYESGIESFIAPSGLKSIGDDAFSDCAKLSVVELSEGVNTIGYWAFAYCASLEEVTLPRSLKSVGGNVFYECEDLTLSVYEGSVGHAYAVSEEIPFILLQSEGRIELGAETVYACVGDQFRAALALSAGIAESDLRYASDNEAVATVDADGLIHAAGKGEAVISYTAGETKAQCRVVVADMAALKLPAAIAVVGEESFAGDASVELADLSETENAVVKVNAFKNCKNLKLVRLAEDTVLEKYAFANCPNLVLQVANESQKAFAAKEGIAYIWNS